MEERSEGGSKGYHGREVGRQGVKTLIGVREGEKEGWRDGGMEG